MKYPRSLTFFLLFFCINASAQRTYQAHSVLSSGDWYKFSVDKPGICKIDGAFLSSLGININIPSSSIRLFGNGGRMLSENNSVARTDDLHEDPIQMFDGGDGVFNTNDYFLFYTPGPDEWIKDSLQSSFHHQKNIYSDVSFYYINIGGNGKRMQSLLNNSIPNVSINSYNFHAFHELDSVNFLSSGKEWYGEELSNTPGHSITRSFQINIPNALSTPALFRSDVVSRSAGSFSRFDVRINNTLVLQHNVAFTGCRG